MSATTHADRRAAILLGLGLVALLGVLGLGGPATRPAAAAPQFDPCGGCPANYACRLVSSGGV
ncbi:MAG: hypothetical protein KKB13_10255, partial [Chloroflexi bacterium]|nr:hypothetical protein [Chloroflexota bacterium]